MSAWLYDRAVIIPGRSLTRSKNVFRRWASHAEGAVIVDTDGRSYIDMLCGLGAISLGYREASSSGFGVCSLPHQIEVEAAETVLEHIAPWASWVRFTKTGSEATHAAYRIAKATTGCDTVLVGDWAYHGWHEWCSTVNPLMKFQHGDDLLWSDHMDIAAVFIEPHRWESVSVDWLHSVRAFCDDSDALLVFDSMLYGGRWALGGASQYFGVTPDLESFGKAYGNGRSVAFLVGTERTKPHGEIPSGTYSGEVSGLSALIDTVQVYRTEPVIETLWARGRQLQAGLLAAIQQNLGVVEGEPVCQRLRFFNDAHKQQFSDAMCDRGVLWHPDVALTMYAHTEAQIQRVIEAAEASCRMLS